MHTTDLIAVTGATGHLGHLVIEQLLTRHPADRIVAAVRSPGKAAALAARGVQVRVADYNRPDSLRAAFADVDRLLLISSSEIGQRFSQHRTVIDAARACGVQLLAYTSLLQADTSPLALALEHLQTEVALQRSGLPFVLLRNGWYTENYALGIPAALAHGSITGATAHAPLSLASRADYAAAASAVLLAGARHAGQTLELAGDHAVTLDDFAAELSRQSGRQIRYRDLSRSAYRAGLLDAGLPEAVADLLSDSDAGAANGGLFNDSGTLGQLIGRPTTPLSDVIASALQS